MLHKLYCINPNTMIVENFRCAFCCSHISRGNAIGVIINSKWAKRAVCTLVRNVSINHYYVKRTCAFGRLILCYLLFGCGLFSFFITFWVRNGHGCRCCYCYHFCCCLLFCFILLRPCGLCSVYLKPKFEYALYCIVLRRTDTTKIRVPDIGKFKSKITPLQQSHFGQHHNVYA